MPDKNTRIEKDSMGELEVPLNALYGANTQRAVLNFPISNLKLSNSFINAITQIKYSAAKVNKDLGLLDNKISSLIQESCKKILSGNHYNEFVVDVFQTGSGTSTNMNVNEVISNIAIQSISGKIGSRDPVHPNDHVNKGQSSNDVIPTAIHIASSMEIKNHLIPSLKKLSAALELKSKEFWPIIKTGRTHLQDATPIRLGQEFEGYKGQIQLGIERCQIALKELSSLALGGTAVGTGVGMHPDFAKNMIQELNKIYNYNFKESPNHFQSQNSKFGDEVNRFQNLNIDRWQNKFPYESRYIFQTIGDMEVISSSKVHDQNHSGDTDYNNHRNFLSREIRDKNKGHIYESFIKVGGNVRGPQNGRAIGKTSYYVTKSNGNFHYPSNHWINFSEDISRINFINGTQNVGGDYFESTKHIDYSTASAYTVQVAEEGHISVIKGPQKIDTLGKPRSRRT